MHVLYIFLTIIFSHMMFVKISSKSFSIKAPSFVNGWLIFLQSRVGPVEWLKPYTDETIVELGRKGVKSLLAVPIR